MSETAERARSTILEHIGKKVPDSTRLVDELGLDSLEVVKLVMTIEYRLQLDIPNEMIDRFVTIGDVIAYVTALVNGSPTTNSPSP